MFYIFYATGILDNVNKKMNFQKSAISTGILAALLILVNTQGVFALPALNSLPIERIKDIAIDETRSTAIIINYDDSVSAYDFSKDSFLFSRKAVAGIENSKTLKIGERGIFVAFFSGVAGETKISVFRIDDIISNAKPEPTAVYYLPVFSQGRVTGKFSEDEKTIFVTYGENSLLFLDTEKVNQKIINIGNTPTRMALDKSGKLFVINEKSNDISIIEPSIRKETKRVEIGKNPSHILFNEKLNLIYVSHTGSDDIYILNTSGAIINKIKVGGNPDSLAYDKNTGEVFVANSSSGTISAIDAKFNVKNIDLQSPAYYRGEPISLFYLNATKKLFALNSTDYKLFIYDSVQQKLIKEVKTDSFPVAIIGSDKLKLALWRDFDANSISVINGETLEVKKVPPDAAKKKTFFSKPQGIVDDEEGNRIFVSNLGNNSVTVIDGNTQQITNSLALGYPIQSSGFNELNKKLYAYSPSGNAVIVVDTSKSDYAYKIISVNRQPFSLSINAKTNKVYVTNSADATLTVIDGNTDKIIENIQLERGSYPILNSIDEKRNKIYVAAYGSNFVYVVDLNTNKIEKTVTVGQNPIFVRYIAELDRVFVTPEGERKVVIINPENNEISQTLPIGGVPYRIFFDPRTDYVYINHRQEGIVTVIGRDENSSGLKVIKEKRMPFWGGTDNRPFNMVTTNRKTNLSYFTSGTNNEVVVVKDVLDDENIRNPVWYATINADGSVVYSQKAQEELAEIQRTKTPTIFGIPLIFILYALAALAVAALIFIILKKLQKPISQ